jgi:hypothetical protein
LESAEDSLLLSSVSIGIIAETERDARMPQRRESMKLHASLRIRMEFLRPNKKHCGAIRRRDARAAWRILQSSERHGLRRKTSFNCGVAAVAFGVMAE